jgi:hypothetical protein
MMAGIAKADIVRDTTGHATSAGQFVSDRAPDDAAPLS